MPRLLTDSMPLSFKLLERSEQADGRVRVRGRFQHCDLKNRNGRVYPRRVWEQHLTNDADFMKSIREGKVFGHLEHPDDGRSNLNLAAIKIENLSMTSEGEVVGELTTLSTRAGKTAASLFNDGLKIGISSRGHGSVQKNTEGIDEVQEDFIPEAFDLVAEPSTPGADLVKEAFESVAPVAALTEGKIPQDVRERVRTENELAMLNSRLETMERLKEAKKVTRVTIHEASDLLYDLHRKFKSELNAADFVNLEERIVAVKEFSRASFPEDDDISMGSSMYRDEEDDDLDMDPDDMPDETECGAMRPEMRGRVRSYGEMGDEWTDAEEDDYDDMPDDMDADAYERVIRSRWQRNVRERREAAKRIILGEMADEAAARELVIFIENDGDLYRQQHTPINKNLITKMARGMYDSRKAAKLFGYLVDAAAKKYAKEMGSGMPWHKMFDKQTRNMAAVELTGTFEAEAKDGEFSHLLPKKYAGFVPEGRRRVREQATADLSHRVEVTIDLTDLSPEQREKFDVFRPGESLETMATVVKAGLPEDLGVTECEGRWLDGDKICIELGFTGNPKSLAKSVSEVMGQKVKLESITDGRDPGAPIGFTPEVVNLIQGLRDRFRAVSSRCEKLETENQRLRDLGDAMTELHRREALQRRQEEILKEHPALQAALPELNKARTVEELEEKAGVFLGIQGQNINFRKPEEDGGKPKKDKKTEGAPSHGSTGVQNGVPRPGELGGGTTVTDGNARTKGSVEEGKTTTSRLSRHYRTR